jgi:hypothetical protein
MAETLELYDMEIGVLNTTANSQQHHSEPSMESNIMVRFPDIAHRPHLTQDE